MDYNDRGHWPDDVVYYGPECVTRYWIYDEEHDCIVYKKICEESIIDKMIREKEMEIKKKTSKR